MVLTTGACRQLREVEVVESGIGLIPSVLWHPDTVFQHKRKSEIVASLLLHEPFYDLLDQFAGILRGIQYKSLKINVGIFIGQIAQ